MEQILFSKCLIQGPICEAAGWPKINFKKYCKINTYFKYLFQGPICEAAGWPPRRDHSAWVQWIWHVSSVQIEIYVGLWNFRK